MISYRPIYSDKEMANGMRDISGRPLTDEEIDFILEEIKRIEADERRFVFNDIENASNGTCYNFTDDIVYVVRNVFPDVKYGSTHPRDRMSIAAVLAHEYYGHRTYRDEYVADLSRGDGLLTTLIWEDECRASITAAKITPNLTDRERADLIMDAVYRAKEYGHLIEMDDFMKEVVYGYPKTERNITLPIPRINYISEESQKRMEGDRKYNCPLPKL